MAVAAGSMAEASRAALTAPRVARSSAGSRSCAAQSRTGLVAQSPLANSLQRRSAGLRASPARRGQGPEPRRPGGARASVIETEGPVKDRWWEKNLPPNMTDLHSTQEFVAALGEAGEKLVVVEFYGTWCGSCRALYPKLCKLANEYSEVLFYKIDFDENKPLCKSLNIRVLPFFHFYRGASGRLDAFPASLSKLQRLKDALAIHSTDRCSLGPPAGPEQVLHPDLVPEAASGITPPVTR